MAICRYCEKEMMDGEPCTVSKLEIRGEHWARIPYGSEKPKWSMDRCGDCGVPRGGHHHPGCDIEQCPSCLHQLISCRCSEGGTAKIHDEDEEWEDIATAISTEAKYVREEEDLFHTGCDFIYITPVGPCGHVGQGHIRDMGRASEPALEEWFHLGQCTEGGAASLFVCRASSFERVGESDLDLARAVASYADSHDRLPWEMVFVTRHGNFKASELLGLPGHPEFERCRYRRARPLTDWAR